MNFSLKILIILIKIKMILKFKKLIDIIRVFNTILVFFINFKIYFEEFEISSISSKIVLKITH